MLIIEVKYDLGTGIEEAFKEAIKLSIKLYCKISFKYMGVICIVMPDSDYKLGVTNFFITKEKISREKLDWDIYEATAF